MSYHVFASAFVKVIAIIVIAATTSCKSASVGGSEAATPDATEIAAAEAVAWQIQRARVDGNWTEVNKHLSELAYGSVKPHAAPSPPFAELVSKMGRLERYDPLLSMGNASYRGFPQVTVTVAERYSKAPNVTVNTELSMLKQNGVWLLAGVRSAI